MKIERVKKEPEFIPVTITLQTQGEVNLVAELLGSVPEAIANKFGVQGIFTMWNDVEVYAKEVPYAISQAQLEV